MSFSNWKKQKKTSATSPVTQPVTKQTLAHSPDLPLVIKPTVSGIDLKKWVADNRPQVQQDLQDNGAILFRGFQVNSVEAFTAFSAAALEQFAAYKEGATPRTNLGAGVYTSTEFPNIEEIALHNELSYVKQPPNQLIFGCLVAPQVGGQTQIADMHKVAENIDPAIIDEFAARGGWMLRRNYHIDGQGGTGFGPTIQKAFETQDLAQIEQYCADADIRFLKISDATVRTEQVRAAVHSHPVSNAPIWFNHIAFWHPSSLCPKVRASMLEALKPEEFPYSTFYGDGTTIPDEVIAAIRAASHKQERKFDWQVGDVLLLDNWRVAHGRKPFEGARKVVVSMG